MSYTDILLDPFACMCVDIHRMHCVAQRYEGSRVYLIHICSGLCCTSSRTVIGTPFYPSRSTFQRGQNQSEDKNDFFNSFWRQKVEQGVQMGQIILLDVYVRRELLTDTTGSDHVGQQWKRWDEFCKLLCIGLRTSANNFVWVVSGSRMEAKTIQRQGNALEKSFMLLHH